MEAKYLEIAEAVKRQIRNGDYLMDKVPSERKLAEAYAVSYMTARRTVQQLVADGALMRGENGRLNVNPAFAVSAEQCKVAMVLPNWPIPSLDKWRRAVAEAVEARGGIVKTVYFDHEDDSVIAEALTGAFSRIFLALPVVTGLMLQRLTPLREKLVLFHHDLTEAGFTCLDASSPENMALLVEHLHCFGHRRIALVNTQPRNEIIDARIAVFRKRMEELELEPQVFDFPVKSFERADLKAYEVVRRLIGQGEFGGTGIVTPTIEAAIGTLRAVHDCGMTPGREISVCAYGGLESARLSIPSITVTTVKDADRQCRELIETILDRSTPERLLYSWEKMEVWQGESTGPVCKERMESCVFC